MTERKARSGKPSQALMARLRRLAMMVEDRLPEAQTRAFDAMEARTIERRLALAGEALEITPLAADAWAVLAMAAPEVSALALELWRQAVAAGTLAAGPGIFVEDAGDFWGIVETRPYMRARAGFAQELRRHGRREEAVAELYDMLRLNHDDNLGMRYLLMGWLLEDRRDAEAEALHARYAGDSYAGWPYAAALLAFRRHGGEGSAEAAAALARALAANPHLAGLLTGQVPMPKAMPEFYSPGSREEAVLAARECRLAWEATPEALAWLARHAPAAPAAGPGGGRRARGA